MKYLLYVVLFGLSFTSWAQELECTVLINKDAMTNNIASNNASIYKEMQNAFESFLNARKWTTDDFEDREKIKCTITINLTSQPQVGNFYASAQITASRPVYGVNYESLTLNYFDKNFNFQYLEGQPMEYNENAYTNNLTHLLAFYAYIMIGVDYDSFSDKGGTQYFQKAQNIVNNAQQTNAPGWKSSESTLNKFWLADNFNDQRLLPFRTVFYNYHKKGLDILATDPLKAQKEIIDGLKVIEKIRVIMTTSVVLTTYFNSKFVEIVNIYSEGSDEIKKEAYNWLLKVDATHNNQYIQIIKPKVDTP